MQRAELETSLESELFRVGQILRRSFDPVLKEAGLARSEWAVLSLLREHGQLSPSQLTEKTELHPTTISQFVGKLIHGKMLLERDAPAKDRRTYDVRLTPAGEGLADKLAREYEEVCRQVLAGVSRQGLEGVVRTLEGIEEP